MNSSFHQVFISLLITSSVLYLEINSQPSNCLSLLDYGANLTNGITAMLITAHDGELLGIRVEWSIKPEYIDCQFTNLRVELTVNIFKDIIDRPTDLTADFINEDFDCNREYQPRVRAILSNVEIIDSGIPVLYGGTLKRRSAPSQLPRVCVGPSSYRGRSNISWDPLPCHFQNGVDITDNDYIIQYNHLPTGEPINISSSDNNLECHQDSGGRYSCLISYASLFIFGETYSFQVAARNVYGLGSFSNPVIAVYGSQDTNCTSSIVNFDRDKITTVMVPVSTTVSENTNILTKSATQNKTTDVQYAYCTCRDLTGWIVMGSLVAIVAVLSGIVITILLIVIFVLLKRLKFKKEQALQDNKSDRIDMKECSAYGQVFSPQTVVEQLHIYETAAL